MKKTDVSAVRNEFPALGQSIHGHPLVYLDSAATTLKPLSVIETLNDFYRLETANVHRGAHYLSDRATEKYEAARERVRAFIGASHHSEVIFTSGTTGAINFVAQTFGRQKLVAGDEILLTEMEHHSNIVPWQVLAEEKGLVIKWAPVLDSGDLDLEAFKALLSERTKLVALAHASNVLGTVNPVRELTRLARETGACVVVDAAQSATFEKLDVQDLDCDFLAFSGHKVYGPFGVGVLYGKLPVLESLAPIGGGGATISSVTKEGVKFLGVPQRFEAGTPNVSGVVGLGAALDFIDRIGLENIKAHERSVLTYAEDALRGLPRIRFIGQSMTRVNLVSFVFEDMHSSDIGQILDQQGVAVRSGHHCTQPLMSRFGVAGTLRASFGVYNNREDIDILSQALKKAGELLK